MWEMQDKQESAGVKLAVSELFELQSESSLFISQ